MIPKYQAWHKTEKKMYSVLALYLQEDGGIEVFDKWVTDFTSGEKDMATKFYQFDDIELREYTGLKDAKGQEIYEGDIVTWHALGKSYKQVVQWIDGRAMFLPNDMKDEVEIIGNIYEHPSLLQKVTS